MVGCVLVVDNKVVSFVSFVTFAVVLVLESFDADAVDRLLLRGAMLSTCLAKLMCNVHVLKFLSRYLH